MAETNLIKNADLKKVASTDFVEQYAKSINDLVELFGITQQIEKVPGQNVKIYTASGTLKTAAVAEGDVIPLSKYETVVSDEFELKYDKYRKAISLEAINEKGYEQAVLDTDKAMLRDIQAGFRTKFFDFIKTGTAEAEGLDLQACLANTWGQLRVLWADYSVADSEMVYFVNPLDAADLLANTTISTQESFGMTYVEKFLGLYDVVVHGGVEKGKVYATAKDNLILYYMNVANSDISQAFNFITDESGYVGVSHDPVYNNVTSETVAISATALYAKLIDHVVIGEIKPENP